MSGPRSPLFFTILAVYLLAGTLFATLTPNWQAPDEPAHYNYVRYLAEQGRFPELTAGCYNQAYLSQLTARRFPPDLPIDSLCYEFHQPPLYYLLAAPVFRLSQGSLIALRLLSVILGAGVVIFAFLAAQVIIPQPAALAYGVMALVAFTPMHVAILASVNNDALAELLLAAVLLGLARRLVTGQRPSGQSDIGSGILLGLGLITKTTVYIAAPLLAVTLWLAAREKAGQAAGRVDWGRLVRQAALIYGLALLIAAPWYIRNAALYGHFDLLGLARHDEVVTGQLRTADFLAQVGRRAYARDFITTTFHSFWGQFGWMAVPMSRRVYLALTLLVLLALGGLFGFWIARLRGGDFAPSGASEATGFWRSTSSSHASHLTPHAPCTRHYALHSGQRQALGLMALTVGLMGLGYGWYNLKYVQFQGRYLFPALIPLSLFMTLGWYESLSWRWRWWLVAGLALAVGWGSVAGWWSGDLDKWAVLLPGLMLLAAVGRIWLARRWLIPTTWLLAAIYAGLALLAVMSPFWYVIPYLSP